MKTSKIREKRKEQIFEAAVCCFIENGFDETKLETIAAKAHISKGGLFHYFKSKKDLFLELFQFRVNKYFEEMKTYIKDGDSPEKKLRILIQTAGNFLKQNEDFYKFCLEFLSMGVRDQEIRRVMTDFYKSSLETFHNIIVQGIQTEHFEKDLDSEKTARTFYLLVMGIFFTYFSINVDFDIFEQQDFQINRILKGIAKK
ncbi:MAG: TetR/AcrR family transcriptional regulator [Pseudomonadota bacterium]